MNFDLSKIYSQQVNKQKVYLNPYVTQTDIIEEAISTGPTSALLVMMLAGKFPDKYKKPVSPTRIEKLQEVGLNELLDDIKSLVDEDGVIRNVNVRGTAMAGDKGELTGKAYSDSFDTLEMDLVTLGQQGKKSPSNFSTKSLTEFINAEGIVDLNALEEYVLANGVEIQAPAAVTLAGKDNKFATPVKENMPGLAFYANVEPITKTGRSQVALKEQGEQAVVAIEELKVQANAALNGQVIGIDPAAARSSISALSNISTRIINKGGAILANDKDQLNGSMSIAQGLYAVGFNPQEHVYLAGFQGGTNLHGFLKGYGAELSGKQEDIWCPADIFVMNRSAAEGGDEATITQIKSTIDKLAGPGASSVDKLNILNGMFVDDFNPSALLEADSSLPKVLAISLKQKTAQGGKAKMFLGGKFGKVINISKEEQNWTIDQYLNGIQTYIQTIIGYVSKYNEYIEFSEEDQQLLASWQSIANADATNFAEGVAANWPGADEVFIKIKYAGFKILSTMMSEEPVIFRDTLLAGRKVLENNTTPSFFKMVETKDGKPSKPEPQFGMSIEITSKYILDKIFSPTASGLYVTMATRELHGDGSEKNPNWAINIRTQGSFTANTGQVAVDTKEVK